MSNGESAPRLIRVGHPMVRGRLTFEPVVPPDGPVTDGPLIRVGHPMQRGVLHFEPVVYLKLNVTLPLDIDEAKVEKVLAKLTEFVDLVNDIDAGYGGAGLAVDAAQSGVRPGRVIQLVLRPNNLVDAEARLTRVAKSLAKAAGWLTDAPVGVSVHSAAEPDRPLFDLAP